jgi:hypothetical protein
MPQTPVLLLVILNLLERVEALETDATEESQNRSFCNEAIVKRLEELEGVENLRQQDEDTELAAIPTPEAAPVATDEQILAMRSWSSHGPTFDSDLVEFGRNCYDLGRQHGAAQPGTRLTSYSVGIAKPVEQWGQGHTPVQPPAAQPTPPAALSDALIKAECALSDIAEGEETNAAPNTFEWAEQRCAETLAIIRPVMQQHKIRTSEWPPVSQRTPAAESAADRVLVNCPETCWVEIRRIADGKIIYSNHRKGELTIPVGEPPAAPPAPAGGLVDQVAKAIHPSICADPNLYRHEARAAIREVAGWLDERGMHGCSLWLREEVDRG